MYSDQNTLVFRDFSLRLISQLNNIPEIIHFIIDRIIRFERDFWGPNVNQTVFRSF